MFRPKLKDFDFTFLWLQDEDRGKIVSSLFQKIYYHVMLGYLADTVKLYFTKLQFRLCLAFSQKFLDELFRVGINYE